MINREKIFPENVIIPQFMARLTNPTTMHLVSRPPRPKVDIFNTVVYFAQPRGLRDVTKNGGIAP